MKTLDPVPLRDLKPPFRSRGFRLAPPGWPGSAHQTAPDFPMDAAVLWRIWLDFAAAQPRTTLLAKDEDARRSVHVQRSARMKFPDVIRAEVIALDAGRAGLVLDSRAKYGLWDFGVNRRRVLSWAEALRGRPTYDE